MEKFERSLEYFDNFDEKKLKDGTKIENCFNLSRIVSVYLKEYEEIWKKFDDQNSLFYSTEDRRLF